MATIACLVWIMIQWRHSAACPLLLSLRTRQFNHSMDTDTAACRRSVVSRRVLMAPISPCERSPGGGALARLAET